MSQIERLGKEQLLMHLIAVRQPKHIPHSRPVQLELLVVLGDIALSRHSAALAVWFAHSHARNILRINTAPLPATLLTYNPVREYQIQSCAFTCQKLCVKDARRTV